HPSLSAACNVSDGYFQVNRVTHENYIEELMQLCIANNIKMVVPTIDTELLVLATNKEKFQKNNIEVIISSVHLTEQCRDKRKINRFFLNHGMEIPVQYEKNK